VIFDAHAHVFPDQGGAAGYADSGEYRAVQQALVARFWGRMLTNTADRVYIPEAGEDVSFRVTEFGRWEWEKRGRRCWMQRFPSLLKGLEWTPAQLLAAMDEVQVDKVLLQAGDYMQRDYELSYFGEIVKQHPDRFVASATINYDITVQPAGRAAELEKLEAAVEDWGCSAVVHGFPVSQPMDDEQFTPFWETLEELSLPHIFSTGFNAKGDYLEQLRKIERVARRFPGVKCVLSHSGGNIRPKGHSDYTEHPADMLPLLALPNVFFEVGYVLAYEDQSQWGRDYEYPYAADLRLVRSIYEKVGASRLLWASDIPNCYRTCTYRQSLDLVRLHYDFMSPEEIAGVLGNNSYELYCGGRAQLGVQKSRRS